MCALVVYVHCMCILCRLLLTNLTDSVNVVGQSQLSVLDDATAKILNERPGNLLRYEVGASVTEYNKIMLIDGSVVFCRDEKHHNDIIVTFKNQSGQIFYGSVERFMTCQSLSTRSHC